MLVREHLGGYVLVSYVAEYTFYNEVKRSCPTIRKKTLQQQIPGSFSFAADIKIQKYYLVQKTVCARDWAIWDESWFLG